MSIIEVTSETWNREILHSNELVLVDFWHEACPWCGRLEPVLEELSHEFHGRVRFVKFNMLADEKHWQIASTLGIFAAPTLFFFCKGKQIGQVLGYRPRATLKTEIEEHSARCSLTRT